MFFDFFFIQPYRDIEYIRQRDNCANIHLVYFFVIHFKSRKIITTSKMISNVTAHSLRDVECVIKHDWPRRDISVINVGTIKQPVSLVAWELPTKKKIFFSTLHNNKNYRGKNLKRIKKSWKFIYNFYLKFVLSY